MAQITTVTLNAAIDKTYRVDGFALGEVSRAAEVISVPGGKGINVARVASQLGGRVLATGFVGGANGQFIVRELDKSGIDHDFVQIDGESRLCLNMIDIRTGVSTELLEPGPEIGADAWSALKRKVREWAARSAVVVFSGSLPRGLPVTAYAELTAIAKTEGAKVFLDTSGEALREGVRAAPDWIKPNADELGLLLGRRPDTEAELYRSLLDISGNGVGCVIATLGADGAVVAAGQQLYRVRAPRIEAVNAVGSGDSFVAGIALGTASGESLEHSLRLASAAGAANALSRQAGDVRGADIRSLLQQVQIETIV